MKITLNEISSDLQNILIEGGEVLDYRVLQSIKCNLEIHALGNIYEKINVNLIEFYIDLKDSFSNVLIRDISSPIREGYEDFLFLIPSKHGCSVTEIFPPYPIGDLSRDYEDVGLSSIRSIIRSIEIEIKSASEGVRDMIFEAFDVNQSRVLFHILNVIDRSYLVKR